MTEEKAVPDFQEMRDVADDWAKCALASSDTQAFAMEVVGLVEEVMALSNTESAFARIEGDLERVRHHAQLTEAENGKVKTVVRLLGEISDDLATRKIGPHFKIAAIRRHGEKESR